MSKITQYYNRHFHECRCNKGQLALLLQSNVKITTSSHVAISGVDNIFRPGSQENSWYYQLGTDALLPVNADNKLKQHQIVCTIFSSHCDSV
jgi:hypothetical protein